MKLDLINNILFKDFNEDILKGKDISGKPKQICIFTEFVFRYFNNIKKDYNYIKEEPTDTIDDNKDNRWFLNPVEVIVNKKYNQLKL